MVSKEWFPWTWLTVWPPVPVFPFASTESFLQSQVLIFTVMSPFKILVSKNATPPKKKKKVILKSSVFIAKGRTSPPWSEDSQARWELSNITLKANARLRYDSYCYFSFSINDLFFLFLLILILIASLLFDPFLYIFFYCLLLLWSGVLLFYFWTVQHFAWLGLW